MSDLQLRLVRTIPIFECAEELTGIQTHTDPRLVDNLFNYCSQVCEIPANDITGPGLNIPFKTQNSETTMLLTMFSITVTTELVLRWALFRHSAMRVILSSFVVLPTVEPGLQNM